jgi:hypothetical protein
LLVERNIGYESRMKVGVKLNDDNPSALRVASEAIPRRLRGLIETTADLYIVGGRLW